MLNKNFVLGSAIIGITLFTGCTDNVSVSKYSINIRQPISIPPICRAKYQALKGAPRVAIMRFNNNSNFAIAHIKNTNKNTSYFGGIISSIRGGLNEIGLGANKNSSKSTTSRVVDPKLDKAITSAVEAVLTQMGGANVYSRQDLSKILKEQKFEQSGLVNEKTISEVGQLAGVKYIITGSIDSVEQDYHDYTQMANLAAYAVMQKDKKKSNKLVAATISLLGLEKSGMIVTTSITFKVIDVSTGRIIFAQQMKASKNIGRYRHPKYSQIIGAIKSDIIFALQKIKPKLSEFFAPNGYITQVKTDSSHKNFIAQINLGSLDKIKAGQTFSVYKFDPYIDPITHKEKCDEYTMNLKLIVSKNQIQPHSAWTVVKGEDAPNIRAGQIIKRDALKNSLMSF